MTGNSYIRPVEIPAGADVTIDLKEHELKFFDVKDSAVKALAGANLSVTNGTLSLTSTDKSLSVLSAEGTDAEALLHADVTVNGPVSVSDGAKLFAANYLEDVRMYGPAGLVVEGEGVSYVTVNDVTEGETSYGTSPYGTIVDTTGTIDHVDKGFWIISRGEHTYFYGSLKEAVDSLEVDDTEIELIGDDNSEKELMAVVLDKSIIINWGDYVASKYSIELTNNADLKTKGIGRFVGNITAAEGSESDLSVTNTYIIGDVNLSGDLTVSGGKIEGDVSAATVSGSDLSIFHGNVTASGYISLTDSRLISSELVESTLNSTGGNISLTKTTGSVSDISATVGAVTIANSEVPSTGEPLTAGTISAVSLDATGNADKPVIIGGNVSVTGDLNLTYVEFNSGTTTAPTVTSTGGDINLTKVSGTAGAITASGEDGDGNVSIDNTGAEVTLTTGALTTENGDISVKGYSSAKPVTVNGNVSASSALTSSNAVFNGTVLAAAITDGSSTTSVSTFKGNVTASGDISLTGSTFNSGTETAPSVTSTGGDISMTNASGTAGAITASGDDGDVTIDNSNATITDPFNTGAVSAKGTVDIKGKEGNLTVDIRENVYANEISIKNAHISATALAKGNTGTVYTPASSVTIENPINASGPSFSYIGNLFADKLSVSATSAGSTLEVGNAVVSGNTESEINAAYFYNLTHTGEGDLTINGGYFENFVYSDASGNNNLNGGIFIVKGSSTDNGFNTINDLLKLVTETGDVTIFSEPCADSSSSFTFVELPESFTFTGLVGGAKATLNFSYGHLGGSTLYGGWIATSAKSFTFDEGITIGESECRMFVTYGNTITSSKDLNDSTAQRVYKLTITTEDETSVYKYSENVYETESPGAYIYSPQFEIVFNTVGLEDGTNVSVSKAFDEYSSITIPSASDLGDDFETDTQKIDGWSTSNATDRTKEFDAEATVTTFTANDDGTNLYAVWKAKGATITFSNTSNYISAITIGSDTYESNGTKAYESGKTFASQGGLATVTLDNTSDTFVGWFTGTNGTGTRYNDSMEVTDDMGTLTLYPCVRNNLETSGNAGDMIVAYAPIYSNTQNAAAISTQSVESTVKQNRRFYYVLGDSSFSFFVYEDGVVSQTSKYIVLRVEDGSTGMTKAEMEITGLSAINAIAKANNVSVLKTSDGYYFHCSDAGGYIDTDSTGATGKMVWQPFSKVWNNPYETVSE